MKSRLVEKLKSNSGESIAEVLVALLIASFGLLLLATMITASVRLIQNGDEYMNNYYENINRIEERSGDGKEGSAKLMSQSENLCNITYYVYSYNNKDIVSYKRAE